MSHHSLVLSLSASVGLLHLCIPLQLSFDSSHLSGQPLLASLLGVSTTYLLTHLKMLIKEHLSAMSGSEHTDHIKSYPHLRDGLSQHQVRSSQCKGRDFGRRASHE